MEPEDKRKLDRALSLAEENNAMLRKMRSAQKTASMWKAIYWVVIIAVTASGYYYLKPFYDTAMGLYAKASTTLNNVNAQIPASVKN